MSTLETLRFLSEQQVCQLAAEHGTPLFVYSESEIRRHYEYFGALRAPWGHTIRYSVKACPSAAILGLFDRLGAHFDASSVYEALRVVRAGISPSKVLLTAQEIDEQAFELVRRGMLFDACSLRQLEAYGARFPGTTVSLRVNPGLGSGLGNRLTSGGSLSSFGIWHEDLDSALALANKHELKVVRLHQHIGSSHQMDTWLQLAKLLLQFAERFPDAQTLNFGGGYYAKGLLADHDYDYHAYWEALGDLLTRAGAKTGRSYHVELEPGTYLMANAGSIITQVIDRVSTGPSGTHFIKINGGLTEILRPSYYGALHPLVIVPRDGRKLDEVAPTLVSGHCCIAGDVLTFKPKDVSEFAPFSLPVPTPGDFLVIERGGAYCASMSMKNFNSFPEAAEVLLMASGDVRVIRRRQTLDQVVQNESNPYSAHT